MFIKLTDLNPNTHGIYFTHVYNNHYLNNRRINSYVGYLGI
jgi:hypothetical protein